MIENFSQNKWKFATFALLGILALVITTPAAYAADRSHQDIISAITTGITNLTNLINGKDLKVYNQVVLSSIASVDAVQCTSTNDFKVHATADLFGDPGSLTYHRTYQTAGSDTIIYDVTETQYFEFAGNGGDSITITVANPSVAGSVAATVFMETSASATASCTRS